MLGERIDDPACVESGGVTDGLDLLPLVTTLAARKTTVRVAAEVAGATFAGQPLSVSAFDGYEIHVGATTRAVPRRSQSCAMPVVLRMKTAPFPTAGSSPDLRARTL